MSWTSDYPTKPGFYWIRNYNIDAWQERIFRSERTIAYVAQTSKGLKFWLFQWPDIIDGSKVVFAEWQGPIEPEKDDVETVSRLDPSVARMLGQPNAYEPRSAPSPPKFKLGPETLCVGCAKASREFVSWPTHKIDGCQYYSLICRQCWIKALTPEQRKIYMIDE